MSTPQPTYPVIVVDAPLDVPGLWVDGIGAAVGIAGFLLAIYFARRGAEQVRKERRITHEIDLLRDLVARTDDAGRGAGAVSIVRALLLILNDPAACPVLRTFANANPTPEGRAGYRDLLQNAGDRLRDAGIDVEDPNYLDDPRLDPGSHLAPGQLDQVTVWRVIRDVCVAEIEAAIRARLHKPH